MYSKWRYQFQYTICMKKNKCMYIFDTVLIWINIFYKEKSLSTYDMSQTGAQNLFDGRAWSMAARVVLATETTDTTVPNLKNIFTTFQVWNFILINSFALCPIHFME